MKKTMNKVAAVMAAVTMLGIGYVAGKANTPTEIKPAIIVAHAHAAIEEQVEEQVEPEIEEQVEEEKETLKDITCVYNNDYGKTVNMYVVRTEEGRYYEAKYMWDAIHTINDVCGRDLRCDDSFGRWQIVDNVTGKAVALRKVVIDN